MRREVADRSEPHLTLVKRMLQRSEQHEYRRFRNAGNESVYIVAALTHYPLLQLTGLAT